MNPLRKLAIAGCVVVLLAGVASGGFRLAMHLAPEYREQLVERLEEALQAQVQIRDLRLAWQGLGPAVALDQVRVQGADPVPIQVESLQVGFDFWSLLQGKPQLRRLTVLGADLMLYRDAETWRVHGLPGSSGERVDGSNPLSGLEGFSRINIRDSVLSIQPGLDAQILGPYSIAEMSLRRRRGGQEITAEIRAGTLAAASLRLQIDEARLRSGEFELTEVDLDEFRSLIPQLNQIPNLRLGRVDGSFTHLGSGQGRAEWRLRADVDMQLGAGQPLQVLGPLVIALGPEYLRVESDQLQVDGPGGAWPAQPAWMEWSRVQSTRVQAQVAFCRLDDLWAIFSPLHSKPLPVSDLVGELNDLTLDWTMDGSWPDLTVRYSEAGFSLPDPQLSLRGLAGEASSSGPRGRLALNAQQMQLSWPDMFAGPVAIDSLTATADWARSGEGVQLEVPDLAYALAGVDGVGRLSREANGSWSTELRFLSPEARRAIVLMPSIWSEGLRRWLDAAVQSAELRSGRLRLNGLAGRLSRTELDLELGQTELQFAPDWPPLQAAAGALSLRDQELRVDIPNARLQTLDVSRLRADLGQSPPGMLRINARISGDGGDALGVLESSPLASNLRDVLDTLAVRGETTTDLALDVNLFRQGDVRWNADLGFAGATLDIRGWPDPLTDIRGGLNLNADGIRGEGIRAKMRNWPLRITASRRAGRSRVRAEGVAKLPEIPGSWPLPAWLRSRLAGATAVVVETAFGGRLPAEIALRSDLVGAAIAMPPPLVKTPDQPRRLYLSYKPESRHLKLQYGQAVAVNAADIGADSERMAIRFGGADTVLPPAPGLWVDGRVDRLQVEPWLDLVADFGRGEGGGRFGALNLSLGSLHLAEQQWLDQEMQILQAGNNWVINLRGDSLQGQLLVSPDPQRGMALAGQFERGSWAWDTTDAGSGTGLRLPESMPALDLRVTRFSLNEQNLGALTLAVAPLEGGYRLDTLRVGADAAPALTLSGNIFHEPATQGVARSGVEFSARAADANAWLRALGYQNTLNAESLEVGGELNWRGPGELEKMALAGDIRFSFENGRLLSVEPGAGRLLGLLSVTALPRRLLLDFSDLTDEGLAFDRLQGQYKLSGGLAQSEGLRMEGPSLRLDARGEINLVDRQQDQIVTIYPGITHGVTAAATVLGGPAMGLFLLVAQELLNKPLDQVSQVSYRLHGSFDDPQVDPIQ